MTVDSKLPRERNFPPRIICPLGQTSSGPPTSHCSGLSWADLCCFLWHLQIFTQGLSFSGWGGRPAGWKLQAGSTPGSSLLPVSDGTFWLMTLTGITWRMYYHRLPEVLMCSQWLPECPGPSQWFASSFLPWFPASLPGLPGSTSPQNCLPLTAPLFQGDPSLRYKVNYYWLREYYK